MTLIISINGKLPSKEYFEKTEGERKQKQCTHSKFEFDNEEETISCGKCGKIWTPTEFMHFWTSEEYQGSEVGSYALRNTIFYLQEEKRGLETTIEELKKERRQLKREITNLKKSNG